MPAKKAVSTSKYQTEFEDVQEQLFHDSLLVMHALSEDAEASPERLREQTNAANELQKSLLTLWQMRHQHNHDNNMGRTVKQAINKVTELKDKYDD